jgi:uncharacterized repeat protein (TIGR01451 family)
MNRNRQGKQIGRGWWVMLGGIALLTLALLGGADAWAAPANNRVNQTVPGRTPTAEPTQLPTVTPTVQPPAPTDTPPSTNPPANPTATSSGGGGSGPTATPRPTDTPATVSTSSATPTPSAVPAFGLLLQLETSPVFVSQGDEIVMRFIVTNPGKVAAVNVQVRNELPKSLSLVANSTTGGTATTEKSAAGATVLLLSWPSLAAGAEAEATVRLVIAPNTPNGSVIDNLAVAWADNAAAFTAGISIGMPPALLPTFD